MNTPRVVRYALTGAALMFGLATAVAAQSTGPFHDGYDPNAPTAGHYHEGELGDKLMVLERNLKCACGCGLDLHSCQFQMQCGISPGWSQRIRESLQAGESVDAVQASFIADFGLAVLLAPPVEGFNLVGYFLPAAAILAVGMLMGLMVRGGTGRETLAPVREVGEADAERPRSAMRKLDESEGPVW